MHTTETRENFNRLYREVSESLAAAKEAVAVVNVSHEEGRREIGGIVYKLQEIQQQFDSELDLLAKHAEWDKFTIAFFGETNAGKSTIIESLRILFDEESRQDLLRANGHDLVKYEEALAQRVEQVREALQAAYESVLVQVESIKSQISGLAVIMEREAAVRNKIVEDETLSRMRIIEREAQDRNKIVEDEALSRLRIMEQEALDRNKIVEDEALSRARIMEREAVDRNKIAEDEALSRVRIVQEETSARIRIKRLLMGAAGLVAGLALGLALPLASWMGR